MKLTIKTPPKKLRELAISEGFSWKGTLFQIDSSSQIFIASKALSIVKLRLENTPVGTITWRTYDNRFYTFTADEFLKFSSAVESYIEGILQTSWEAIDKEE